MKLGQDVVTGRAINSGDVTIKKFAWETSGHRRFAPWLEGGVAGRMVGLYTVWI